MNIAKRHNTESYRAVPIWKKNEIDEMGTNRSKSSSLNDIFLLIASKKLVKISIFFFSTPLSVTPYGVFFFHQNGYIQTNRQAEFLIHLLNLISL